MIRRKSKRVEILSRILPYVNTGNYYESDGYIVFGASSPEEVFDDLTRDPGRLEDQPFWDVVTSILSDFKVHGGKLQAAERVSLDQAQEFKSAALDGLSAVDRERLRRIAEQALPQVQATVKRSNTVPCRADEDDLDAALVIELLGKVPEAVSRTISLDQLNLDQVPDQHVRRYFSEAHLCYLCGFNVALRRFRELIRVCFPEVTHLTCNQACN